MKNNILEVAEVLKKGGVALVETDTNYALACLARDETACKLIYDLKKRLPEKPLSLFVSSIEEATNYCLFSSDKSEELFFKIANKYWPGALNIILPSGELAPKHKFFDKNSISIVFNKDKTLNELIREVGSPLALTSANISGEVFDDLISKNQAADRFEGVIVLNTGPNDKITTQSSTIIKIINDKFEIIRKGDIIVYV